MKDKGLRGFIGTLKCLVGRVRLRRVGKAATVVFGVFAVAMLFADRPDLTLWAVGVGMFIGSVSW